MIKQRRELLFLYSTKDANPNGDPLNDNHPRFDEETEQIQVSDVRIKRTVRDELVRTGETVFIDGKPKTLASRYKELKQEMGTKDGRETMKKCIDSRLFGTTFAAGKKETFAWTGPVQFKWGRSLHKAKAQLIQGTAAFTTKDGNEQRSFRNEYIVPYALITTSAIVNQNAAENTGAEDADIEKLKDALWNGTKNLLTRSKTEHRPVLLLEIKYKEGYNGHLGALEESITLRNKNGTELDNEEQLQIRSLKEFTLDLTELNNRIGAIKDNLESLKMITDFQLQITGMDIEKENR